VGVDLQNGSYGDPMTMSGEPGYVVCGRLTIASGRHSSFLQELAAMRFF